MNTQNKSCLEWRIPPSRCCAAIGAARLARRQTQLRAGVVVAAAAQDRPVYSIPESRDEAVSTIIQGLYERCLTQVAVWCGSLASPDMGHSKLTVTAS